MRRILFVIPYLGAGGAERVLTTLLNELDREKFLPSLVLFNRKGEFLKDVPARVKIYDLNKKSRLSFPKLVTGMAQLVRREKPDVVVSFLEYANLVCLWAKRISPSGRTKWIISERSLPSAALASGIRNRIKQKLHKWLDRTADLVITNSNQTKEVLIDRFGLSQNKVDVIPNPVDIARIQRLSSQTPPCPWFAQNVPVIISIGRLSKPKNYPCLIEAFSMVLKHTDARLIILGQGAMRGHLESMIDRLDLKDKVHMPGFVSNPYCYLRRSSIFVLPSLWEGLPNALLEAMALGKPIVATRANRSIEELIEDGRHGILVATGSAYALSKAIIKLLANRDCWERFSQNCRDAISCFDVRAVVKQYEKVLQEL